MRSERKKKRKSFRPFIFLCKFFAGRRTAKKDENILRRVKHGRMGKVRATKFGEWSVKKKEPRKR